VPFVVTYEHKMNALWGAEVYPQVKHIQTEYIQHILRW